MAGRRVVLVPGNHDHQLIGSVARAPAAARDAAAAGARAADRAAARPRRWPRRSWPAGSAPAPLERRLSGGVAARRRLRDPRPLPRPPRDVPAFERIGARSIERFVARRRPAAARRRRLRGGPRARSTRCCTSVAQSVAGRRRRTGRARRRRRGKALAGRRRTPARPARSSRASPIPAAIGADQRASGSDRCAPSSRAPRCAGRACGRSARCCAGSTCEREHVVFGHTHRPGPWPGDDPGEWRHGRRAHASTPARGSTSRFFLGVRSPTRARTGRARAS